MVMMNVGYTGALLAFVHVMYIEIYVNQSLTESLKRYPIAQ